MSKLPCKFYQVGLCLRSNCKFSHGDDNFGTRRVSHEGCNIQNKHDFPKRAKTYDYFSPHLQSTRNNRFAVDSKGRRYSSLQDYHGYEDLGNPSLAYQRNQRERSRSQEGSRRFYDRRCISPRLQNNKRKRDISTHENPQSLNFPSSKIAEEKYEGFEKIEEGEITEDFYMSPDVKVEDCKTHADKVSDASSYNLLPTTNNTIVQRRNNHKKKAKITNHMKKLNHEENNVMKKDNPKEYGSRSPTTNEGKMHFASGSDPKLHPTCASCLCKYALPKNSLASLKDMIVGGNHHLSINVSTSKMDLRVTGSKSTIFSEVEHTHREPCLGCEKVEDFIAQIEKMINASQRKIS